jgi:hypothetical protein
VDLCNAMTDTVSAGETIPGVSNCSSCVEHMPPQTSSGSPPLDSNVVYNFHCMLYTIGQLSEYRFIP